LITILILCINISISGPIVDIFHGTALVAFRAILSKLVPANQLGMELIKPVIIIN